MNLAPTELQRQFFIVKEKVEVLNGDLRKASDQRAFRYSELKDTQNQIAILKLTAQELNKQFQTLQAETADLETQLATVQDGLDAANTALAALEAEIATTQANLDDVSSTADAAGSSADSAQASADAAQATADAAQAGVNTINARAGSVTVPVQTSAAAAASPPTKAEFDKVVVDMAAVITAIGQLRAAIVP